MARLKELYKSRIVPELTKEFSYKNRMAVPKINKVVISMGIGRAVENKKYLDQALQDLIALSGQKPVICKAKKSVSNFKVRAGDKTGLKVTLRKGRMYEFLDKLINLTIPQVRDFRGLSPKGFDGRGNFSMGLSEQSVFPEIDTANIEATQGMNITIVTTAESDEESRRMLDLFGMPFKKSGSES